LSEYKELLKKLEAVEVDYDPCACENLETARPVKTAFVPLPLFEDVLKFVKSLRSERKQKMSRQVFFIVGIDDDHKPVHTTRVCSDPVSAASLRQQVAANYHEALLCQEVNHTRLCTGPCKADLLARLQDAKMIFDPTFDHHHGSEQPPKVALIPHELFHDLEECLGEGKTPAA